MLKAKDAMLKAFRPMQGNFLINYKNQMLNQSTDLSPTIAIEQKTTSRNPRSTVATQTEIYDYMRLLFARIGTPHCPECGKRIEQQSAQEIVSQILKLPLGTKFTLLAPLVQGKKGEYRNIQKQVTKAGFARLRVDGKIYKIDDVITLDRYKIHNIEIVVDRMVQKEDIKKRLADSIETALQIGQGTMIMQNETHQTENLF